MFNFEKLDVWQEAIQFADLVYQLTGDFPGEERFGLTNQMRRAAVSISYNLAEGSSRVSRTDFGRFVEIATGSLFEVVSQSAIALRRKMIAQNDCCRIYARTCRCAYARAAETDSRLLSHSHGHAGCPVQFAPADPRAFDRAQDCFPDAVAEQGTINQSHWQDAPGAHNRFAFQNAGERGEEHIHRQECHDKRQDCAPRTKRQRSEKE